MGKVAVVTFFFLLCVASSLAYLPGVAPQDYEEGSEIKLTVNKLTSVKTQFPYEYYKAPYCRPDHVVEEQENLAQVLVGDRLESSDYQVLMGLPSACNVLCKKTLDDGDANKFRELIDDEYRVNWLLDYLPAATRVHDEAHPNNIITYYERGFLVGFKKNDKYYLNNHVKLIVKYHWNEQDPQATEKRTARIVGFEVEPFSVQHVIEGQWNEKQLEQNKLTTCKAAGSIASGAEALYQNQPVDAKGDVVFTYDVEFVESPEKWASRWDHYLLMGDNQIHWFSIINSLMIVLFLTGMVAMIMLRTLHRDIRRYNEIAANTEEAQEETGWKLVHGDVFRPPVHPLLLSVYVGSGVQCFAMAVSTLFFAVLGFLSPANRGGLLLAMLLLFVFMGVFAGYYSARLYKTLKGDQWKRCTMMTAFGFPGVVFCIFFVLNGFSYFHQSTYVPFGSMFFLLVLWFGISVPLVFLGSYFGYKKPEVKHPVRTNQIPRQIPEQAWYMKPIFSILVGGILPFGAVFIELFFIMSSIWLHQFYYVFGFLFLVMIILVITCAEISIVMCYFQLCSEDYHWWWRSYLTSGSSAVYLFAYSILYFATRLQITKFLSALMFFGYMFIISYAFFIVTGTIGFFACFVFVRQIYAYVKVD
eukprot:GILJ01001007.1.p1 GENE.GILJ01001007.1~~GILJ01001007.1.p1  ORF type:complete len:642 (+),score=115.94 GILJ01001007.1:20-1945(+)